MAHIFARLLDPLALALGHPAMLRDQIDEDAQIGEYDQRDHPNRLRPAGYVVTTEQVAEDRDQQPEPQHENKDRQDVGEKIRKSETARKQHHYSRFSSARMPSAGREFNLRLRRLPPARPPAPLVRPPPWFRRTNCASPCRPRHAMRQGPCRLPSYGSAGTARHCPIAAFSPPAL